MKEQEKVLQFRKKYDIKLKTFDDKTIIEILKKIIGILKKLLIICFQVK